MFSVIGDHLLEFSNSVRVRAPATRDISDSALTRPKTNHTRIPGPGDHQMVYGNVAKPKKNGCVQAEGFPNATR